jgi:membrane protein YdbS with pleckstrin-like domain
MKTSIAVAATLLLVFAVAFAVVRMDWVGADALRFLPVVAAVIIAIGLISPAIIKRVQKRRRLQSPMKEDKK